MWRLCPLRRLRNGPKGPPREETIGPFRDETIGPSRYEKLVLCEAKILLMSFGSGLLRVVTYVISRVRSNLGCFFL